MKETETQRRYNIMGLSEQECIELLTPHGVWGWFTRHKRLYWIYQTFTWNFWEGKTRNYSRNPRWLRRLILHDIPNQLEAAEDGLIEAEEKKP